MMMSILANATRLSDDDLLARLNALAGKEREATVELIAHLAALDSRPSLFAALGHGSLFAYCAEVLRLSEDATCNRIEAARACRRFPVLLEHLASGAMSLTSVRLLARHLTEANHRDVLARARGRSRREIEVLVARLAPRADVPSTVRKLPAPSSRPDSAAPPPVESAVPSPAVDDVRAVPAARTARPVVQPTAPERYRVQFTIGPATHERLRRLQALLRREIPDGDPAAIFDRAIALLLERVESRKLGVTKRERASIRPGTDGDASASGRGEPSGALAGTNEGPARRDLDIRTLPPTPRSVPRAVRRASWRRDGARCAFVSADGHRCTERVFLEFHHVRPHASGGPATLDNISLRCRRHNLYEAEVVFGARALVSHRE